jgi:hypothetical protein
MENDSVKFEISPKNKRFFLFFIFLVFFISLALFIYSTLKNKIFDPLDLIIFLPFIFILFIEESYYVRIFFENGKFIFKSLLGINRTKAIKMEDIEKIIYENNFKIFGGSHGASIMAFPTFWVITKKSKKYNLFEVENKEKFIKLILDNKINYEGN